jgi:hypothetical protein
MTAGWSASLSASVWARDHPLRSFGYDHEAIKSKKAIAMTLKFVYTWRCKYGC